MKKCVYSLILLTIVLPFFLHQRVFGCEGELPPDIEALLDPEIIEVEAPVPVVPLTQCFPTESILSILTPATTPEQSPPIINAVAILAEDLYRKTTGPVTRRSLLDEPALIPDNFYNNYWTFTVDLFYNFSPKVFFTKNSAFLSCYIDLTNENIINELDSVEFIEADVPGILGLFHTIKLQQHRAGLMVNVARQWDRWLFNVRMPLYYMLENFYLTNDEIKAIENNPFFSSDDGGVGTSPKDDVMLFALKHLVGDKLGVGDMRASFLGHLYSSPRQNLWFGLQVTLPTAKTFKRGIIGGEFDPDEPIPPFNLQHFFNVYFCNTNQTLANTVIINELTNFLVSALDRLSTILINAPLGNGKHWGIGPELDFRYHFDEYFSMHIYSALQAFAPHHEPRFYLLDKTQEDLVRDWRDPALAGENLALLNRLVVSTLFPVGIETTIHPGLTFQINEAFMYKNSHWDLKLGFDYWYQASEKMSALLPVVPCDLPFNRVKAHRPAAQQGKLFASGGYYDILQDCIDWYICLNVDGTVLNTGIGENYTFSLRFGAEF